MKNLVHASKFFQTTLMGERCARIKKFCFLKYMICIRSDLVKNDSKYCLSLPSYLPIKVLSFIMTK